MGGGESSLQNKYQKIQGTNVMRKGPNKLGKGPNKIQNGPNVCQLGPNEDCLGDPSGRVDKKSKHKNLKRTCDALI